MAEKSITTNSPHPDWHSEDAANLRAFFRTKTGGKFLGMLSQLRPGFTAANMETAALEGKVIDGWERCTDLILRAGLMKSSSSEVIESVEYPDLDSDHGWDRNLKSTEQEEPAVLESQADIENLSKRAE
jgi:hypothetical protein